MFHFYKSEQLLTSIVKKEDATHYLALTFSKTDFYPPDVNSPIKDH